MDDKNNIKAHNQVIFDKRRSKILCYYNYELTKCKDLIIQTYNDGLPGCTYEVPIDPLMYDIWGEAERNECCLFILTKLRNNGYVCSFEFPSHIIIQVKKKIVEEIYTIKDAEIKKKLIAEDKKTKKIKMQKEYE